jgi:uncharacterized protein YggE
MNNNIIVAVIAVVIVIIGFLIYGAMSNESETDTNVVTATTTRSATSAEVEAQLEIEAEARAEREAKEAKEAKAKEVAFIIEVANLPEAQQTALKAAGVNETSIEITNAMLTCARVDMSETRVNEIKGGASVTVNEGIKLVSCYKANSN